MEAKVHTCALPGCGEAVEHDPERPGKLYCSGEHQRAARRMRSESAHRPSRSGIRQQGGTGPTLGDGTSARRGSRVPEGRGGKTPATGPPERTAERIDSGPDGAATRSTRAGRPAPEPRSPERLERAGEVASSDAGARRHPSAPVPETAPRAGRVPPEELPELTHDALVRPLPYPGSGWQRRLQGDESGEPGAGARPAHRGTPAERVRAALAAPHQVAVISLKGGVGKTTVAAGLGLSLSQARGDRVVALDAAPDPGTLADRLTGPLPASVRELVEAGDSVTSLAELSGYCGLAERLSVVAGEQDPRLDRGFDAEGHARAMGVLTRFFDILISDCGPGLMHPASSAAVTGAHGLVVVGSPAHDGATRASATLDWLAAHGHQDKARAAVVALTCDRRSPVGTTERVRSHFAGRARAVVEIPHDPHLESGGRIRVDELRPGTRDAFLELAAAVADGFTG